MESFKVNGTTNVLNLLVGFGASSVPLDLGYDSSWNTSVYWNQQDGPALNGGTVDNSGFQSRSYDTSTAQLTNLDTGGQLYNASTAAEVGAQSPAPGNRWYFYPNYIVEQVLSQDNSNPPFPAAAVTTNSDGTTDMAGEQTAYNYISKQILGDAAGTTCNYEGIGYSGIHCEYVDLNAAGAPPSTCGGPTLSATENVAATNPANRSDYAGPPISNADWYAVNNQLYQCFYAANVQSLYANYGSIVDAVPINNTDPILNLAGNLGISQQATISPIFSVRP